MRKLSPFNSVLEMETICLKIGEKRYNNCWTPSFPYLFTSFLARQPYFCLNKVNLMDLTVSLTIGETISIEKKIAISLSK